MVYRSTAGRASVPPGCCEPGHSTRRGSPGCPTAREGLHGCHLKGGHQPWTPNTAASRGRSVWKARRGCAHANPWSVYTRIPITCALALAVWSRDWIGWWSVLPIALVAAWTAVNPRAFPPPRSLDHWASKAVFGETLWTNRLSAPIPRGHRRAP